MFHLRPREIRTGFGTHRLPHQTIGLILGEIFLAVVVVVSITLIALRFDPTLIQELSHRANPPAALFSAVAPPTQGPLTELKSTIPSERAAAAQALGSMHAVDATDALLTATLDPDSGVREQSAIALGEIGAIRAMPRLTDLVVTDGNTFVKQAAIEAREKVFRSVAAILDEPRAAIEAVAVAPNGTAYTVASNDLYNLNDGSWVYIGRLPDTLKDIAVAPDGTTLYLSTLTSGLYKSQNGGQNWEYLHFGLQTPTQLMVTALLIDPIHPQQLYAALAGPGSDGSESSLGIVISQDGGHTWYSIRGSPMQSVTNDLAIDPSIPGSLYGLSDNGPWRYELPAD